MGQVGSFLAGLAGLIAIIAIIVAYKQHRQQIRDSDLHALFYVHGYLADERFAKARREVRSSLCSKPFKDWGEDEYEAADLVATSYDQAGILFNLGVVSDESKQRFLESSWGRSICDQWEVLDQDWLDEHKVVGRPARDFFIHFEGLYEDARLLHD